MHLMSAGTVSVRRVDKIFTADKQLCDVLPVAIVSQLMNSLWCSVILLQRFSSIL